MTGSTEPVTGEVPDPVEGPAAVARAPRAPRTWRSIVKLVAVGVVALFVVVFVVTNWEGVRDGLLRLTVGDVALALVAALLGIMASMLSWRSLVQGAGSPLSVAAAARIFFLAQLGKYVPGSIWPIVAQMELSQRYDVPKARAAFSALTQMLVGVATGVVVAAVALVLSPTTALEQYWWLWVVGVVSLVALAPPVLNVGVRLAARLTGGRLDAAEPLRWSTIGAAAGWGVLMWLAFGVHLWVMADQLAPATDGLFLLSTGGYALASVVGILIIVLPAGAGAREAVVVLVFAGVLGRDDALVVALVSRFVMLVADLLGAGVAVLVSRRRPPVLDQPVME